MNNEQLNKLTNVITSKNTKETELFNTIKESAKSSLKDLNSLKEKYSYNIFNEEGEIIFTGDDAAYLFMSSIYTDETVGIFLNLEQNSFNAKPFIYFNGNEKITITKDEFLKMLDNPKNYEKLKFVLNPENLISNSIKILTKKSADISQKIREIKL